MTSFNKLMQNLALLGAVALSAPVSAYASDGATLVSAHHRSHAQQIADWGLPPTATALAPSMFVPVLPETDGLSRNPDDCKYGCIDN